MTTLYMAVRELGHRRLTSAMSVLAVAVAVGACSAAVTVLRVHAARNAAILARKQAELRARVETLGEEMRKATLKLSFNLLILPKNQNLRDWYAQDYASECMPEEYADRLAASGTVLVRHLLPSLQQKVFWKEQNRNIILMGTRDEVPDPHKEPGKPLIEPVPPGTVVLGHELHRTARLSVGTVVSLLGREFRVHKCHEARGSKDDITAWIHLSEAQELLGKKGKINAILALECLCAEPEKLLGRIREEVGKSLPDTQVVEHGSRALARAEARQKVAEEGEALIREENRSRAQTLANLEHVAAVALPAVLGACGLWLGLMAFANVRGRRPEVGLLRAVGFTSGRVLVLFLSKAGLVGLAGGAIGSIAGVLAGRRAGGGLAEGGADPAAVPALFDPALFGSAVGLAVLLSLIASWIPAALAARIDPADIVRQE